MFHRHQYSINSLNIFRSSEKGDLISSKAFDYYWEQLDHTHRSLVGSESYEASSMSKSLNTGLLFTAELKGHKGCVNAIEFANDPTKLFASGIFL